jgi:hypothetical protein
MKVQMEMKKNLCEEFQITCIWMINSFSVIFLLREHTFLFTTNHLLSKWMIYSPARSLSSFDNPEKAD